MIRSCCLLLTLLSLPLCAEAVVVAGGDGTQNTTAPEDDFGFRNVGQIFSPTDRFFQSCVYLGDNWILTTYHTVRNASTDGFSLSQVVLYDPLRGAVTFQAIEGSGIRLRNADNSFTDLALFQIAGVPDFLSPVTIAEEPPPVDGTVYMAGNGIPREPDLTHWNIDSTPDPDAWSEASNDGQHSGYKLIGTASRIRWGTNTVEGTSSGSPTFQVDAGYGRISAIKTDFDNVTGEAQGVAGDSGGGVFYKRGAWELSGVIFSRDYRDGQTGLGMDTAVFGNGTYFADLSRYREQIINTIPEPTTAGLLAAGITLLTGRHRRRQQLAETENPG